MKISRKKLLFIFKFGLAVSLMFSQLACSNLVNIKHEELYSTLPLLHIDEPVKYEKSPFSKIVEKSFPNIVANVPTERSKHFVHILDVGEEALLARIHLIRNAKKAIYVQTFIWRNDESGRYVIKELIDAAKRGVKVYILVDKLGFEDDPNLTAYFTDAHPNIRIKLYNPSADSVSPSAIAVAGQIAFKFKKFNQRMHNKIMVFDDQIAITGGRNFQNDYFDRSRTRNFKDRDVIIVGPIVKEMTDSFAKFWAFRWSVSTDDFIDVEQIIKNKSYEKHIADDMFEFGRLFSQIDKEASDYDAIEEKIVKNMLAVDKVSFVSDEPGKNKKRSLKGGGNVAKQVVDLMRKAQKEIIFQTPYLVLDKESIKTVKRLRKNNKNLDILISTNSLASTDKVYAYAYSFKQRKELIKQLRFRIFEFKPQPEDVNLLMPNYDDEIISKYVENEGSVIGEVIDTITFSSEKMRMCIHGKSVVVDDEIAWTGSFNLDPRSIHLNTEVGLAIWDKEVAKRLKENILRDIAPQNSWTVGKRKEVPVVSKFSGFIGGMLERIPVVDVWPFQYSTLYQLNEKGEQKPFYDGLFDENYTNVGSFPGVGISTDRIQLMLIESLGGIAEPLI